MCPGPQMCRAWTVRYRFPGTVWFASEDQPSPIAGEPEERAPLSFFAPGCLGGTMRGSEGAICINSRVMPGANGESGLTMSCRVFEAALHRIRHGEHALALRAGENVAEQRHFGENLIEGRQRRERAAHLHRSRSEIELAAAWWRLPAAPRSPRCVKRTGHARQRTARAECRTRTARARHCARAAELLPGRFCTLIASPRTKNRVAVSKPVRSATPCPSRLTSRFMSPPTACG